MSVKDKGFFVLYILNVTKGEPKGLRSIIKMLVILEDWGLTRTFAVFSEISSWKETNLYHPSVNRALARLTPLCSNPELKLWCPWIGVELLENMAALQTQFPESLVHKCGPRTNPINVPWELV